jgi:hypothetical protein
MVVGFIHKATLSGLAAALAAGAGIVTSASVTTVPAYGAVAFAFEADAVARNANRVFDRADLNKDGALDIDEYQILAAVTAELANLNGFASFDAGEGVRIVEISKVSKSDLAANDKAAIRAKAVREFSYLSGDDERLAPDEFVTAEIERFIANDRDRNGVLTGAELAAFAMTQTKLTWSDS